MRSKSAKNLQPQWKRQWGAERRTNPLSSIHGQPSTLKIALSRLAVVLTIVFWVIYLVTTIIREFFEGPHTFRFTLEAIGYLVVVTFLTFSALMYLVARQGALQRFSKHLRVPRAHLDRHFAAQQPSITVLVPSYSEEVDVIRKTLLSAALQEYPHLRVVLLLDDNPHPSDPGVLERLNESRAIGEDLANFLQEPRQRFTALLQQFEARKRRSSLASKLIIRELALEYNWAANWLEARAEQEVLEDHVDLFFIEQVLGKLAHDLRLIGQALEASSDEGSKLPLDRVHQLYRRLAWTFKADFEVFERKRYASLSHEANKAMNLNSYIGLMGKSYRQEMTPDGLILLPTKNKTDQTVTFPDSDFLLTLDADSILLQEYCLRLVYFLQQAGNADVAVTQTPYSSFRGAGTRIERLAGASTDIQHILHQGMSYFNATFWVGANAIIRKKALEDIVEKEWIGGFEIHRYVQDRTVIEDTESSIDLGVHGWKLVNYPERLSYSATPPDFGSLVIQRRRWANGGLLILPKYLSQIKQRQRAHEYVSLTEIMLRMNYMASIAWASFGLLFLLAFPYDGRLLSPFVLLAALPYFSAMASDLKYCGYKRTDIFRIYGFNIILLPVNLAGVIKSMQQALTGKKIPFVRTPKVKSHTVTPLLYVIVPVGIVAFSVLTLMRDFEAHNWANAAFAAFNAFVSTWAIIAYIGIRHALVDIWVGLTDWMYVDVKPTASEKPVTVEPVLDWKSILYHGDTKSTLPLSEHAEMATVHTNEEMLSI